MTLMKLDKDTLLPSFSNLWEDFFGRDIIDLPSWRTGVSIPAVNIEEKPDQFLISLAVPGFKRQDFKIDVSNGVLTIASEREEEQEDKKDTYTRREFSYRSFKRSFTLPEGIRLDQIEAKYEDGILNIHLPKKEESKLAHTRHIAIQ
jgi:HSP20 family protein